MEVLFRYKLAVSYCKLLASHEKLLSTNEEEQDEEEKSKGPNYVR
jgi:hypothetical protein